MDRSRALELAEETLLEQADTVDAFTREAVPEAITELLGRPESQRRIGPFVLLQQLGRGGFAPVWLAREQYGNVELRSVAIKLFALEPGQERVSDQRRRFILDEARALSQIEHPSVVRFYSLAVDEARGVVGLAMEYLPGRALDLVLAERGRLSVHDAVEVGLAISQALAVVHRAGVVHRDIKPANIVETEGGYKLIDFGVAHGGPLGAGECAHEASDVPLSAITVRTRASEALHTAKTRPRRLALEICGTLGYVDPECMARGVPADAKSDLYGLGATLFELLSGRLPAASDTVLRGEVLDGRRRPEPLALLAPDLPPALADLVDALLSPEREERPGSAQWVASRLQEIRHQLRGRKRQPPPEQLGPFRGLARFEATDREIYFGRASELLQLLQVLRANGLVAMLGPSGSGKSSLARAALLPAILDGELGSWPEQWDSVIIAPGGDPRRNLTERLEPLIGPCSDRSPYEIVAALSLRAESEQRGSIVLVDQLEELATLSEPDSRDWLVALLELASEPLPGLRLVVTTRRDLLDPLLALPGLGRALLRNSVLVEPFTAVTWSEVLDLGLSAYGYGWESEGLKERAVRELAKAASAMPLIQFALNRLWERRDPERRVLTSEAYEAMGGVVGALAQHAEATYDTLVRDLRSEVHGSLTLENGVKRVLLALTSAQGTAAVRKIDALERIGGPSARRVLDAFERARLVVELPEGYTLAHEALLEAWPRLRVWQSEARDARLLIERFEHDGQSFQTDPESVPLWRGRRLRLLEDARAALGIELDEASRFFLAASRRAELRRRIAASAVLALVGAAALGIGFAYFDGIGAEQARTHAALERERDSRILAEARTREIQNAQQRIDELLSQIPNSPQRSEVTELQTRIRELASQIPSAAPSPRRPETRATAAPAPEPPPPASSSAASRNEPPRLRVQQDW